LALLCGQQRSFALSYDFLGNMQTLYPSPIALVDDDPEFVDFLGQYLKELGMEVHVFRDSNDLLTVAEPYGFAFYVLDLGLPGVDGLELIRLLRRRSKAGILVVSGRLALDVFDTVILAGADMYLSKPVRFEQVALAIKAVQRRVAVPAEGAVSWRLDLRNSELIAPDNVRIALSAADLAVLECFLEAGGEVVPHAALCAKLGLTPKDDSDNSLHAAIYRMRRRIERMTPISVPLQSQSRVGYVFRAPLSQF
jgi:two-component system OmpR family response regulator